MASGRETTGGFQWLEHSYSRREVSLTWITGDPSFDGVRNDPRYLDLLKRLGLEETQTRVRITPDGNIMLQSVCSSL
jgi:hypothetical protein